VKTTDINVTLESMV